MSARIPRPAVLVAACVVIAIAASFVPVSTGNPPGFYRDESGIAERCAARAIGAQ
jgi:hypothetical protein